MLKSLQTITLFFCLFSFSMGQIQASGESAKGELLISFTEGVSETEIQDLLNSYEFEKIKQFKIVPNTYLVRQKSVSTRTMATQNEYDQLHTIKNQIDRESSVQLSSMNFRYYAIKTPNDPGLQGVYAMNNTGQTGGTTDADIDAVEAWDVNTGRKDIIVGIIDTGVDYDHPDLINNIWKNPGETPSNGIDDDGNGYIDDIYGWDWAYSDNDPSDYCGHGTHCAGTVGAVGNNGEGVAGVCWNVKIMALKFLDDYGSGYSSNAISALEYAANMGAHLTSNSWGGGSYDVMLETAIANSNILFIAAAGNSGTNNDYNPHYPSSYEVDNIIAVAATDHNDLKADFSCYGLTSVDLAAPGVNILSTKPDKPTDISFGSPGWGLSSTYYGVISGTSMATPAVSGAAALIYSRNPSISWQEAKAALMDNVDLIPSMSGMTVTGGRLNVFNAVKSVGSGIVFTPDSLNFGLIGIGESKTLSMVISNYTDSLQNINITSDNNVFELSQELINLPAYENATLEITYIPANVQNYTATLTCSYSDSIKYITISGSADYLPNIEISPDHFKFELSSNDSSEQVLTISNTGTVDLSWNISGQLTSNLAVDVYPQHYYQPISKNSPDSRIGKQVLTNSGGPDGFGYAWLDSDEENGLTFEWIDISSTGIEINGFSDDNFVGPYPVGFEFPFYGDSYEEFYIGSNGLVGFGQAEGYQNPNNYPIPRELSPNNFIAWFWDDLAPNNANVFYQSFDDYLVIQFQDYEQFGSDGAVNAEIILYRNGSVKLQYLSFENDIDVLHATVGIENAAGDDGLEIVFNNSYLHDSLAVFISASNWLSVSENSGIINPGSSQNINIKVNTKNLLPGTYYSCIQVFSNDEDKSPLAIPVEMTIDAQNITFSANMSLYELAGYFDPDINDEVFVSGSFNEWAIDSYYALSETGPDIYGAQFPMYGNTGDTVRYKFFVKTGNGRFLPNDGWEENVGQSPADPENRIFTLSGEDQVLSTVFFNNNDIGWPKIAVTPDSVNVTLFEGDSTLTNMTIRNEGQKDLKWQAEISKRTNSNKKLSELARIIDPKQIKMSYADSLASFIIPDLNAAELSNGSLYGSLEESYFFDGFEEGNFDQWTIAGGTYTREVTKETSAQGKYSFKQDGSGSHFSGVYTQFESCSPEDISFYVRPSGNNPHCYYVIGDNNIQSNVGIIFFYAYNGVFRIYTDERVAEVPYASDEWYFIEFKNVDFVSKTFDYYINSELIASQFPFRSKTSSAVTMVYLYNYSSSATAFYDNIAVGEYSSFKFIGVSPDSGLLAPSSEEVLQIKVNAKEMKWGVYEKSILISSNDPLNPQVNIPLTIEVLMKDPPVIQVNPDSICNTITEGDSVLSLMTIHNAGTGDLEYQISHQTSRPDASYLISVPESSVSYRPDKNSPDDVRSVKAAEFQLDADDLSGVTIMWDIAHGQSSYSSWSTFINALITRGANVVINSSPITETVLADVDVFYSIDLYNNFTSAEILALSDWIKTGGGMLIESDGSYTYFNSLLSSLDAGIVITGSGGSSGSTSNIYPHEVTKDVNTVYFSGPMANISSVSGSAQKLVDDSYNRTLAACSNIQGGNIVVITDEIFYNSYITTEDNLLLGNQIIDWLAGGGPWLSYMPAEGVIVPGDEHRIKIWHKATSLKQGEYSAVLKIESNDPVKQEVYVPNNLTVLLPDPPEIITSPDSIFITLDLGDSAIHHITIENEGIGNLNWQADYKYVDKSELSLSYLMAETDLYKKYKKNVRFEELNDSYNSGPAKVGPIPLSVMNAQTGSTKIVAWVKYTDMDGEYQNVLNAISQYYTNYTISTTTTSDASVLKNELNTADVFLIPEQETGGSKTEFSNLGSAWKNVLQDFVKNGGAVILCGSVNGSEYILSQSDLMHLNYTNYSVSSNMTVWNQDHYLTKGFPSLIPVNNLTVFYSISDIDAEKLAGKSSSTEVAIAARSIGRGHVVALGYDYYAFDDYAAKLIANAVQWTSSLSWLSLSPDQGIVSPSGAVNIDVHVNTKDLLDGFYHADIIIESNDFDEPEIIIPLELTVIGSPKIYTKNDEMDFGNVIIGDSVSQDLKIYNIGSKALEISELQVQQAQFIIDPVGFSIAPFDSQVVTVWFNPDEALSCHDTLTILNNDTTLKIAVCGTGCYPPDIFVSTDSIGVNLVLGDSTNNSFLIFNNGLGNLNWEIVFGNSSIMQNNYTLSLIENPSTKPMDEEGAVEPEVTRRNYPITAELSNLSGVKILWDNTHGQGSYGSWSTIIADLTLRGAQITENQNSITNRILDDYNIFWTKDITISYTTAEIETIKNWVLNGGCLIMEGDDNLSLESFNGILTSLEAGFLYNQANGYSGITTNISSHETTMNVDEITLPGNLATIYKTDAQAIMLIYDQSLNGNTAYAPAGNGKVMAMADELMSDISIYSSDNQLFANQVFDFMAKGLPGWLDISPLNAVTLPEDSNSVSVKINAKNLKAGEYASMISVLSNDPDQPEVYITVSLRVNNPDAIVNSVSGLLPKAFELHQNFPNPFNPSTTIKFDLPENSKVILKVYDVLGREVATLINRDLLAGFHHVVWNGKTNANSQAATGIYFIRLITDQYVKTRKMMMLK
ncbi:MAG: S8 family serine peptidase [Calditrichaceae bacterium]|nr:S8 family serine peptidase [Calditrichaceae bacterium]RQV93065.1 MAG: choice-of-anchor D domain-containing protein [Calditrichota bacterium]